MDSAPRTWPVASGSLVVGFAIAQATGVRPLGGIALVAGAGWCALQWRRRVGLGRAAGLTGVYLAAFAGSHGLAHVIGAWPAVAVAAGVVGAATYAAADVPALLPRRAARA